MKKIVSGLVLTVGLTFGALAQKANLNYTINLNDRSNDEFKVTLNVKRLGEENKIYQFAATAPGTYQTMNIGRFVRDFKALDKKGREIPSEKISENQWQISNPKKVRKIEYRIAETWDTPVEEHQMYRMCGTSMEDDHVLFNTHCVLGYPEGMQAEPLTIDMQYPTDWKIGTALSKNDDGAYYAKNYDFAVDSPVLLGRLSEASTELNGTKVEIFTYSVTDKVKSEDLMASMKSMLQAANEFVVDFPVDRYTFLFHFEDQNQGAWEHSYSSEYVYNEADYAENGGEKITATAAHEFFHIITPLNIHSEIIEQFNFVTPTTSDHLWLYEGTTEWASDMMQVRGGLTDLNGLLVELQQKMVVDTYFDPSVSLVELARTSFTPEGQQQYGNIYYRGALVINLLDIRLLELSGGKRGMREVVNELSKKYGPEKAFDEANFFEEFVAFTHPEIADFFDQYIKNANPLPMKEYYSKVGIDYQDSKVSDEIVPTIGSGFDVKNGQDIYFKGVTPELNALGVNENDVIRKVGETDLNLGNANALLGQLMQTPIGEEYSLTVERDGETTELTVKMLSQQKEEKFVFTPNPNATPEQLALRDVWLKNL